MMHIQANACSRGYAGLQSPNPFAGYTHSYQTSGYSAPSYFYTGANLRQGGYTGHDGFYRSGAYRSGGGGYGCSHPTGCSSPRWGGGGWGNGWGNGRHGGGLGFIERPGWFGNQYVPWNTYFGSIQNAISGLIPSYNGGFNNFGGGLGFGGLGGGLGGGFGAIV